MSSPIVVSNAGRLARLAAERIAELASSAIAERGCFVWALAGGSTPRPTYRLLAQVQGDIDRPGDGGRPQAPAIDWRRVEVFWGDERCVPPDHPDSNYRMACRALIDHVQIPKDRVHRIRGELPPHEAAAVYRAELKIPRSESTGPLATSRAAALGRRRFDVILLGLGPDGHTASLFPGTEAVRERRQDAVAVYVERLDAWRVTLTLRIINDARHVIFLVSGEGKAEALARVHAGENLPAGLVQPTEGSVAWLVDRDAAAKLPPGRSGGPADPV